MNEQMKLPIDVASVAVLGGSLIQVLPSIASLLTVIWLAFRIYEMCTVQRWLYGSKGLCKHTED